MSAAVSAIAGYKLLLSTMLRHEICQRTPPDFVPWELLLIFSFIL